MRHKQGIDRHQAALLPPSVEDYVVSPEKQPIHLIINNKTEKTSHFVDQKC